MNHSHIAHWLDRRDPGHWTVAELEQVARHAANCPECRAAWAAAQAARELLHQRAASTLAPPPGFAASVMCAIELPPPSLAARLWRANTRLIYATAACVAALAILTLREEFAIRSREFSETIIDAASVAVVHDLAMGGTDEDAVSN